MSTQTNKLDPIKSKEVEKEIIELCKKQKWDLSKNTNKEKHNSPYTILTPYGEFPFRHPIYVNLAIYRREKDQEVKYEHFLKAHNLLWPKFEKTWNSWDEIRFRAHCSDYKYISLASGASCAKSHSTARIASLFWLSNPRKNTCIISSTTLDSLESRIWGYVAKFLKEASIELPIKITSGTTPRIRIKGSVDKIHGMFAVPVKQGDAKKTLSNIIGRHPDYGIMIALDESTDISVNVVKAFPNLEKGVEFFQCWTIGNSSSKFDLHGALSTPKKGWASVSVKDKIWETNYDKGICLYFNPYTSPAITDPDEEKRELFSKYLPTLEGIEKEKKERGEKDPEFLRFTMGFWPEEEADVTMVSEPFMLESDVRKFAEWSGFYPLKLCAGLDPASSIGGCDCTLRIAILGHSTESNKMAIDFREESLLFRINPIMMRGKSSERQVVEAVIKILSEYNIPLHHLTIDATGMGRSIAELLKTVMESSTSPCKIVSSGFNNELRHSKNDPSVLTASPFFMWSMFKSFLQNRQIKGLDEIAIKQFTTRKVVTKGDKMGLESKRDYKDRMAAIAPSLARSPDEADAAVLTVISAMVNFGLSPGQTKDLPIQAAPEQFVAKIKALQTEIAIKRGEMVDFREVLGEPERMKRGSIKAKFNVSVEDTMYTKKGNA